MKNKENALGLALILHLFLSLTEGILISVIQPFITLPAALTALTVIFSVLRFTVPVLYYRSASGYTPFLTPLSSGKAERSTHTKAQAALLFVFALSVTVTALNAVGALTELFKSLFGGSSSVSTVQKTDALYVLLKSVFLASFLEEILFRGAFLHAFSERRGAFKILLSATAFALMHGSAEQFFYAFTAGAVIAFVTVISGSLSLAIVCHLGANMTTFIFTLLKERLSGTAYSLSAAITFITLFLLSLFSGVIYFLWFHKKATKAENGESDLPKEMWIYLIASALLAAVGAFLPR